MKVLSYFYGLKLKLSKGFKGTNGYVILCLIMSEFSD